MNIVLGFGVTEKQFEENLEDFLLDYVTKEYSASKQVYFENEFVARVETWAKNLALNSQEKAREYKTSADYPDRYTSYWISVVSSASYIVFIVTFHHVNRRHAMSPDGWGIMATKKAFFIDTWQADALRSNKDAVA